MLHVQEPVDNWLQAVAKLPAKALVKATSVQWLSEARATNPGVYTCHRYVNDPLQDVNPDDTDEIRTNRARDWFNRFIDDTFLNQQTAGIPHWLATNFVSWWNEYYANGQTWEHEAFWRQERIAAKVWRDEYRNGPNREKLQNIRLTIAAAPVGNDIPWQTAETAKIYDCVVDYHPYKHYTALNTVDPGDWQYHSGRWNAMDIDFRNRGFTVNWIFGEAGPYQAAETGWRSDVCLGGNAAAYVESMRAWIRNLATTNAYQTGRLFGFALFTTGGGDRWKTFETKQPEMNDLADMIRAEWKPGTVVTPPPNPLPGLRLASPFHEPFVVSSPFDAPREYGKHEGCDYVATSQQGNELIHCGYDGTVDIVAYSATGYGKYVRVKHVRNGGVFYTYYCHLDTQLVAVGNAVKTGDPLGEVGSTGNSTGPHVHITLRVPNYGASGYVVPDVVNPDPYIDRWITPPRRYNRTCHLLPQDATPAEYNRATSEAYALRQSVLQSIDDALITHPNLTGRKVYVWGDVSRHGAFTDVASFEAWVVQNYPPLPEIIYRGF